MATFVKLKVYNKKQHKVCNNSQEMQSLNNLSSFLLYAIFNLFADTRACQRSGAHASLGVFDFVTRVRDMIKDILSTLHLSVLSYSFLLSFLAVSQLKVSPNFACNRMRTMTALGRVSAKL